MRRKLLSIALTLSMVVQLVPTPALAQMVGELEGEAQDVLEQVASVGGDGALAEASGDEGQAGDASSKQGDGAAQADGATGAGVAQADGAASDGATQADDADDANATQADAATGAGDAADTAGDASAGDTAATPADESAANGASDDTSSPVPAEGDAANTEDGAQLSAQATEDPFYFMDVETGQLVTTLRTTGTYQLVHADGTPYTDWTTVYFEYQGSNPRGEDGTYHVSPKEADTDDDGEYDAYYLEDFTYFYAGVDWQLPTGTYRIYNKNTWDHGYFAQSYRVISDSLYDPHFRLTDDPSMYYEGSADFHVKPYTEGKSDHDYDQQSFEMDEHGTAIYFWITPDQNPFLLASDTRIDFWIDTPFSMTESNKPQLESIALWKSDESIETLVGTYDKETWESTPGAYSRLDRHSISRIPQILAESGFNTLPSWPTYLNFNDDSKLTTLWQRGDESLNERVELDSYDVANGTCTSTQVIIDHANFSDTVASDGVYFPVVKMSLAGETYTYAYHPIQVDASGTSARNDPRITTTSLKDAYVGDEYTATFEGKSGAIEAGELSWAVTDGELPEGLSLNAATGVISGTPTTAGEKTFTITLTETIGGEARAATCDFRIRVRPAVAPETAFEQLSLGPISYTPATIWVPSAYGKSVYTNLKIPISLDIRDERYNLGETELVYMLKMTMTYSDEPAYYVWRERAVDLMSDDGTTLEVAAPLVKGVLSSPSELLRIRAFLLPQTNDGELAFPHELADNGTYSDGTPYSILPAFVTLAEKYGAEPGDAVTSDDGTTTTESQSYCFMNSDGSSASYNWSGTYAHYVNMPEMPYTALENPKIAFGSWVRFSGLRFEDDDEGSPVYSGRIRLWAYDGTTVPTTQQVKPLSLNGYDPDDARYHNDDPVFKLAPGTYAFVVEGEVPVYDENGVETDEVAYIDISDKVSGATALKGTTPQQFIFTVGPGKGSEYEPVHYDVTYSAARVQEAEAHSLTATFETEDGSYVDADEAMPNGSVDYQIAWYRRVGDDESSDVLVATGDYVMFGPSEHDLYVEVTPTGRGASFWKTSGKVKVSDKNKAITVRVPRKQLFRGTFVLSCASGKTPAEDEAWGILEVRTPQFNGGYASYNVWAYENHITLPDLTSGSVVTFTPNVSLDAGSVEYTVPEDASATFAAQLTAPLAAGVISFEGLSFTDVNGTTSTFSLDDGSTEVRVERVWDDGQGANSAEVPFYQSDGTHITLQPECFYGHYFLQHDTETTYRVTVTHNDVDAPTCLGGDVADYAARKSFEVKLSPEQPSASISAATLVSRGYATIPVDASSNTACTLLLYNADGELVDKDATVSASAEMRTPFLDPGFYTLYAVDANLLLHGSISRVSDLRKDVLISERADHGVSVDFTINEGTATKVDTLAYPNWEDHADLIDHANSSVSVSASYNSNVSVTMHAMLVDGAELSDDAYLEISTNQPSGIYGEGYMSPKSLSMNGKALKLNRWENLFDQTQCMDDGSLRILLAEAKKLDETTADFPLDMTLVIPRTQTAYTEASVWLVSDGGKTRSLVGTSRQESHDVSLTAPSTVAWQSFYVYGETGPNADVVLYLNGMRVATSRSDDYGYYTAEITLPDNLLDYSSFSLQAMAQWTTKGGDVHSATSPVQEVTYTTTFPVVERITMCYQSSGGDDIYHDIVTYYRGKMPDKYASVYRSENERHTQGKEHAKDFWLVEFANGEGVSNVKVNIPRSASSVELQTTDSLKTAESWIDDVKTEIKFSNPFVMGGEIAAKSETGQRVRDAFASDEVHAFVTKPEYLTYAASSVEVTFDFDGDINYTLPMRGAADMGHFQGFAKCNQDALSTFLGAMGTHGNVLVCTAEDIANIGTDGRVLWDDQPRVSASALASGAGNIDEWLLLGSSRVPRADGDTEAAIEENSLLKVHHQVTAQDMSAEQVQSEVQGVINEAQRVIGPVEDWLYDGGDLPSGDELVYNGRHLAQAVSTRTTQDDSYLYYIGTVDDNHNMQIETLATYYLKDSDSFVYVRTRADGSQLVLTSWDEKNGQRVDVTYTIAEDQVDEQTGYREVVLQWSSVMTTLFDAINEAGNAVDEQHVQQTQSAQGELTSQSAEAASGEGDPASGEDDPASGEVDPASGEGNSEEGALVSQNDDLRAFGLGSFFGGAARDQAASWSIKNLLGHGDKFNDENYIKNLNASLNITDVEQLNKALDEQMKNPDGPGLDEKRVKGAFENAAAGTELIVADTAIMTASTLSGAGGTAGGLIKSAAVTVATTPGMAGYRQGVSDILDTTVAKKRKRYRKGDDWLYDWYWKAKWRETKGKYTGLWILDTFLPKDMHDDFEATWKAEYNSFRKKAAKQNGKTSDPSGIVYEAVLSNAVEGATVKLYTFNPAASNFGLDPAQFVDSTQFGIEDNPQTTAADGRYQWFVPSGYWQVRVSKKGYESFSTGDYGHEEQRPTYKVVHNDELNADEYVPVTDGAGNPVMETVWVGDYGLDATKTLTYTDASGKAQAVESDSYWMPVLPVQLDVNIPLVSLAPPAIEKVEADEDGVTVTFTKYVKPDTVTAGLFKVNGAKPSAIAAADAEAAGDGSGEMLARTYRLSYPAGTKLSPGDNDVNVAYDDLEGKVTSYAGIGVADDAKYVSKDVVVHVDPVDIAGATVEPIADQTYTGKALKPEPTVTYDGATLVKGTDYTLEYSNNVKAGTAKVTVKGKGNYTGKIVVSFKIVSTKPFFLDVDPADEGNHGTEVDWMGRAGISTGWEVSGGREYRGMLNVTRCDFAAFLYRLADLSDNGKRDDSIGLTDARVKEVLGDVSDCDPKTTYHAMEVAWMIDSGISRGWANKDGKTVSFRPVANVARQDMAAFLYRFADLQDDGKQNKSLSNGSEKVTFSDVRHGDEANHAAEVEWMASIGVTKGWKMKNGTYQFRGMNTVARQDMAAFMYRLNTYLNK